MCIVKLIAITNNAAPPGTAPSTPTTPTIGASPSSSTSSTSTTPGTAPSPPTATPECSNGYKSDCDPAKSVEYGFMCKDEDGDGTGKCCYRDGFQPVPSPNPGLVGADKNKCCSGQVSIQSGGTLRCCYQVNDDKCCVRIGGWCSQHAPATNASCCSGMCGSGGICVENPNIP